jgi:hypothetical protein
MMSLLRRAHLQRQWWWYALIVVVLLLAAALGYRPSPLWLVLPFGIAALLILLHQPLLGLFVPILAALLEFTELHRHTAPATGKTLLGI